MTIAFENDNDVIVYASEKVISYARRTQLLFVAQCVWWLASIVGLEQGLVSYIDNLREQEEKPKTHHPLEAREVSSTPRNLQEDTRIQEVLDQAEEIIKPSRRERRRLRSSGRVNP
jgi:3-mercaptopyruvate sulfurtransferase SseA